MLLLRSTLFFGRGGAVVVIKKNKYTGVTRKTTVSIFDLVNIAVMSPLKGFYDMTSHVTDCRLAVPDILGIPGILLSNT